MAPILSNFFELFIENLRACLRHIEEKQSSYGRWSSKIALIFASFDKVKAEL